MPNYCNNILIVSAKNNKGIKELKDFKNTAKKPIKKLKSCISFENLFPTPKELLDEKAPAPDNKIKKFQKLYSADDWYDWRIKNWSTKWDAIDPYLNNIKNDYLNYCFDTAWSPPLNLFVEVSKKYPNLTFELNYEERGMWFAGSFKVKNGNIIFDRQYEPEPYEDEEGLK